MTGDDSLNLVSQQKKNRKIVAIKNVNGEGSTVFQVILFLSMLLNRWNINKIKVNYF